MTAKTLALTLCLLALTGPLAQAQSAIATPVPLAPAVGPAPAPALAQPSPVTMGTVMTSPPAMVMTMPSNSSIVGCNNQPTKQAATTCFDNLKASGAVGN